MARSFIIWLHGSNDCGSNNTYISDYFSSPEFSHTSWSFPSAPSNPITCYGGVVIPSWFDIPERPITAKTERDEKGVLKAVQFVHSIINKEIEAGTNPENIFVCGFSQGGALAIASALLYPKTLGGGVVFSGSIPFNSSIADRIPPPAKKTSILWLHGTADDSVLFEAGEAGCKFLEELGMTCEFKVYPDLDHSLSPDELQYFQSWVKMHLKGL
ncbi:hypothetical protein LUZ60_002228 [Juncus effusus]|nr:hypothetical protein LUZ60_002228 [Juncus effusus]